MKQRLTSLVGIAAVAAVATAFASHDVAAQSSSKTLKFIPQADLRIVDPVWTTAYITRNHGYMVYDTLFATDANFKVQPQMAETHTASPDGLTHTIKLRDGLKWHDGQPVKPADCIASIRRWSKRDAFGQKTAEMIAEMTVVDDRTFAIKLKAPYPALIESLGKLSSNVPFMMPERVANTDANEQIKETIGSGPFKFVREEWVPGNKVVYVKNTDYVPRKEPPSWAAGGKVVKVDRVEWVYIPDPATAAAAMSAGEADIWEQLHPDLVPVLARSRDIVVDNIDPLGSIGIIRFNHLQPPFNNPKMRQALQYLVDQKEYLTAIAGDQKNWKTCYAYYTCDTPMASEAGAEVLKGARSLDKAKQLVKEAGYNGEKIVVLSATDQPIVHGQALITTELLRKIGVNVELHANDWGTLITRRASKEPVDKGGWSIFHTWWVGPDMVNPALNSALRGNGAGAWFGWPTNEKIEKLRNDWFVAPNLDEQKKLAAEIQMAAYEAAPYIPVGQFKIPTAYRKNISGIIVAPVAFLWNIEKK
ncbi:MAG TPA: ABC transporter substrate-binding protein [Alphaproteobacteria bacterium]|nr:ABC transporter substrate-binding protein [Alphaproteobacteria bacterium]